MRKGKSSCSGRCRQAKRGHHDEKLISHYAEEAGVEQKPMSLPEQSSRPGKEQTVLSGS
ncbi:hypothetical protein PO124_20155 [Bacillus licheniformis]|nr:hypothetical protein [Bacillus licheniformis]